MDGNEQPILDRLNPLFYPLKLNNGWLFKEREVMKSVYLMEEKKL